ncbi:ead/Ea22-like family protein [Acinetobacter baumannii]|uniref:ead/Ea22-like family protein n=1 Tax=Acinetobacter calcoaceticus/baumannii complex TaxID=909768 RepID=UPI001EE94895|nr:ead/Ea22-like family protein [Acinetobacter baumannii]MCG5955811.1 ead/Ea22-like family protein [Acinetobacter baumannii]
MKPTLFTPEAWAEFTQQLKNSWENDNAGTDSPIFVVQSKNIVWGLDPASDSVEITNIVDVDQESKYKSVEEFFDSLKAAEKHDLNGLAIDEEDELFLDVKVSTQINILSEWNERNVYICHGKYFWEDINCHLTRSAAEAFINRKSHDYGELRVFVKSLYWCDEFKNLLNAIINGEVGLTSKDDDNILNVLGPSDSKVGSETESTSVGKTPKKSKKAETKVENWTRYHNGKPVQSSPLSELMEKLKKTKTADDANSLIEEIKDWATEDQSLFKTELNKHLVIIAGHSKENISIGEKIRQAKDLTTLDALEIDISEADERIQERLMELVVKRRKELEVEGNFLLESPQ